MKAKMSILPVAMMGGTAGEGRVGAGQNEARRMKRAARRLVPRAAALPWAQLTCLAARAGDEVHHPLGKAFSKDLHCGDVRCKSDIRD
jgi:hypothetical protein